MDGVLVDGEPLHFEAVNLLLAEEGEAISLEQYKPYMGTKSGWRR
jgi:beta-phosphoglucomutase-like phosphatase (HAD superfamily)